MIPASGRGGGGPLLLLLAPALLAGCTGPPQPTGVGPDPSRTSAAPAPSSVPLTPTRSPLPIPTATGPSSLPASPSARLAPVRSSPDDLARVDVRGGSPRRRSALARLPRAKGFTVTAGCVGAPGTLIHWSVLGERNDAFLFGSSTPCNGVFLTDAGLEVAHGPTSARLQVVLDPGVEHATVVLRRALG